MSGIDRRILSKRDDLAAFRTEVQAWLGEVIAPDTMQRMIDASEDEARLQHQQIADPRRGEMPQPRLDRDPAEVAGLRGLAVPGAVAANLLDVVAALG